MYVYLHLHTHTIIIPPPGRDGGIINCAVVSVCPGLQPNSRTVRPRKSKIEELICLTTVCTVYPDTVELIHVGICRLSH